MKDKITRSRPLPGCGVGQMPCITAEPPANLSVRLQKVYTMLIALQEVCAARHLQRISAAASEIHQIIKEIK